MDEELYRLVSTGLLGLIVLLLVLAIARLGKLQRGPSAGEAPKTEPEPAGIEETANEHEALLAPSGSAPGDPTPAANADDQEEGPFERDGRWWYRREGELLVYDERIEQWVDPSAPAAAASEPEAHPLDEAKGWDATPSTHAPIPEPVSPPQPITEIDTGAEQAEQAADSESGSHWKCPACGVINGSTATSCRMCFAARP